MSASRRHSIGMVFQAAFVYRIRQPENGICALWLALGVALTMRFMPAGHLLSLLRQSVNLHSLSARQLLRPKNMATALQMLARCPTLLRFAPCIHAFMPQNLFTRIMNTGSKQKKGDPDVQVCFADFPHSASFFGACELVALRAPSGNARLFPKKGCCVRLDVGEMQ